MKKKTIYDIIIEHTLKLIESPFIIKAIATSKKIKKKLKKKSLMKITYLKEDRRLQNSFKQLYFYNLAFFENNFKIRLLKSIITTFLEWDNSYLYKLKNSIFKKFLKNL